ncbi:MAG: NUDIX hydrolase [Spirochaetota bacterium]
MTVVPRKASTVAVVRENPGGGDFQVLLLRRNGESSFLPHNYVFPGGALEEQDDMPCFREFCAGMNSGQADVILGDEIDVSNRLSIWVAGIRETFEETGLLYAYEHDGKPLEFAGNLKKELYCEYRKRMFAGEITFREMLAHENLSLAVDRLCYLSRWVTPDFSPIRYDARFFLAEAPSGQDVIHDGQEITEHTWITPADALRRNREGSLPMVLPTVHTLQQLTKFQSIGEAISSLGSDARLEEFFTG